ncbi:MAG: four helix bundle protein [Lewinellaceae bacterium]|nr:four helix bundle protein [Phaeodactylibacter sp.]MCB9036767.1 four helix bundle protein [Lewinellaceae bacterium]
MEKKYLRLKDIDAYITAFNLSNYIWDVVMEWDKFPRWTVGKQLVESADSIAANLAEGWGRFYKKEKIQFYRYSNGSREECQNWIKKAIIRKLIQPAQASFIEQELAKLPKEINQLIQYTNMKLKY